jgi:replicative DNA helicase
MTQLPPNNPEAEASVIGSILRGGKNTLFSIAHILQGPDFFSRVNRTIYDAMAHLGENGVEIDPVTVGNILKERNKLGAIGGAITLSNLLDGVATVANIEHYAKIVRDKASVRRMIYTARSIVSEGQSVEDADEYISESVAKVNKVVRYRNRSEDFLHADQDLHEVLKKITDDKPPADIIPTGLFGIDKAYGGIVSPLLYLVAGRPSMGKSTLLLGLGIRLAQAKRRVLYCTLEDSQQMQQMRLLSYFSGVPLIGILKGSLCQDDKSRILGATANIQGLPLTFTSKRGLYASDIRRQALAFQAEYGLDILMVDHLGYIRGPVKEYDRNSLNIRAMADLAGELNVPLLLAYQLNRDLEKRDDKLPKLSDLRGTGTAEEDARAIWFVYRPHYYKPEEPASLFQVKVAKASFGPLCTIDLHCDMRCYRVGNPPEPYGADEY